MSIQKTVEYVEQPKQAVTPRSKKEFTLEFKNQVMGVFKSGV